MIYRSLNAAIQEIRLITLDPAPFVTVKVTDPASQQKSAPTDPVQCRLEHVSLDSSKLLQAFKETPPDKSSSQVDWDDCHKPAAYGDVPQWRYSWGDYVALSYAWGDPTRKRNIVLNGHQTAVGANLEAALRVLRCKQPIRAGYKIWIDALCINQQDLVERGQHLNRMQKIYKQAHDVVIWLGDEEDDSNKAMDLIRTLSSFFRAGQASVLGTALRQQPDLLGRGSWRALSVLLDRPYWDRLWVLQEIALGGYQSPILCGHQAVRWEELYSAIYYFGAHNFDVMFSLIDQERKDAGLPAAGLKRNKLIHLNEEQLVQTQQRKSQLMCMLDLGRKSLATDPRDKVYGLLGLMEASVSDQIIPDYTLPLSKVFTAFTKAMIVANDSLEILEQCSWSTKAMPSWVPDWTDQNHFRLFGGRSTYHAIKSFNAIFRFDNNDQHLSCQGVKIDEIDGLGKSYYEYVENDRLRDAIVQPKSSKNIYGSEDAFKEALWRTLVGNRDHRGSKAPDDYQCLLECSFKENQESARHESRGSRAFNRLTTQSADFLIAGRKLSSYFPQLQNVTLTIYGIRRKECFDSCEREG